MLFVICSLFLCICQGMHPISIILLLLYVHCIICIKYYWKKCWPANLHTSVELLWQQLSMKNIQFQSDQQMLGYNNCRRLRLSAPSYKAYFSSWAHTFFLCLTLVVKHMQSYVNNRVHAAIIFNTHSTGTIVIYQLSSFVDNGHGKSVTVHRDRVLKGGWC